jgi:capsular polysaccharide biosynthesis protein
MSQKALDLRRSMQIVRRRKLLVGILVALGILGGAAYAIAKPAMLTSTALIALTPSATVQPATTTGGTDAYTATQEIVAGSTPVLVAALHDVRPEMSLNELRLNVQVASPAADIISVTAKGKKASDAEATANAVADSYINLVSSSRNAVVHVQAQLLQPASPGTGPSKTERPIVFALQGGLAGVLIGVIVALAIGRSDRRLRERDEIANSIGTPVLASIPVAHPSAAAGWMRLFENYQPAAVHAWQLRTALQQLGMPRPGFGRPLFNGNGSSSYDEGRAAMYEGERFSLMVLSLSSDPGALALGPQLAVFAASQNIPTSLVVGSQQDAAATATLRTACASQPFETPIHHGLLRVTTFDEGGVDMHPETALVIVAAVVDSRAPQLPHSTPTNATVIGVSAGAATAEQLARAAVAAAADGRQITGILVADPEPTDPTTGRIAHLGRPARHRAPNRSRGIVTEIKR